MKKALRVSGILATLSICVVVVAEFYCPSAIDHWSTDSAIIDIRSLQAALDFYKIEQGRFPTADEGLEALVDRYITRMRTDPWGNDYVYAPRSDLDAKPRVYSFGPNGLDEFGGFDDVVGRDKVYKCELNYRCPTFCDHARNAGYVAAFLSTAFFVLLVLTLYVRSVIFRHRA